MESCDVAIVGAGPFGLSTAAYLREIKGLEIGLFGEPMSFWERCMPPRMLLRSEWHATHIAAPKKGLTLDEYAAHNGRFGEPIPVARFICYGRWFHDQGGVAADRRKVVRVEPVAKGHRLTLEDGTSLRARRVVIATGIESYAYKPEIFRKLSTELVSHSSELRDYSALRDKHVAVIGGGQSALEATAFLCDGGAHVEIFVREPSVCPGRRVQLLKKILNKKRLKFLYGRGAVGEAGISLLIERPNLFARLSDPTRRNWDRKSTKLGFAFRLVPSLNGTPIRYGQAVERVDVRGSRVAVRLSDGSERIVDHVVLGTGYRVAVAKCGLLPNAILDRLQSVNGYPVLDSGLESSIPGLHFSGAAAAHTFGPLLRFVAGTGFAASAFARKVRNEKKH